MSIKSDFKTIIESVNNNGTKPYDSTGVVRRVEGDTIWVHIAGGVDETPVKKTVNAKVGDKVQVRVSGGRAFIVGNETAPPTDDTTARSAITMATDAEESANNARSYANSAFISAQQAKADAEEAEQAAGTAKQAADTALVELANVQDVAGVLEWITNHGEMVSQSGGTFNPYEVYFILDPNGVYEVQGSNYSIVSEPKAEDIDDYFVLNVDKSIQNYVSTHIAVNSEGLWLIPEDNATAATSSKKILIAVGGQGHTYSEAGTYILEKVNDADTILAQFTTNGAVMNTRDAQGNLYHIATLGYGLGNSGSGTAIRPYYTFGRRISGSAVGNYSVAEGSSVTASGETSHAEGSSTSATAQGAHAEGTGTTASSFDAHAEGYYSVAGAGGYTHAEGNHTTASEFGAHAEGGQTVASGQLSHAQNNSTIAAKDNQTAIGKFNIEDTETTTAKQKAFIIGNGTNYTRSNAFDVAWDGETRLAIDTSASAGTTDGDLYSAIAVLGWTSAVIE